MACPRYICVLNYHTGNMLYLGTGEWRAAECLVPGTVFGIGSSESSATAHAMRRLEEQNQAIRT